MIDPRVAERTGLALAASMALRPIDEPLAEMMAEEVRAVLARWPERDGDLYPVRLAVEGIAQARGIRETSLAHSRLRYAVRTYFTELAIRRVEEWRQMDGA